MREEQSAKILPCGPLYLIRFNSEPWTDTSWIHVDGGSKAPGVLSASKPASIAVAMKASELTSIASRVVID